MGKHNRRCCPARVMNVHLGWACALSKSEKQLWREAHSCTHNFQGCHVKEERLLPFGLTLNDRSHQEYAAFRACFEDGNAGAPPCVSRRRRAGTILVHHASRVDMIALMEACNFFLAKMKITVCSCVRLYVKDSHVLDALVRSALLTWEGQCRGWNCPSPTLFSLFIRFNTHHFS